MTDTVWRDWLVSAGMLKQVQHDARGRVVVAGRHDGYYMTRGGGLGGAGAA